MKYFIPKGSQCARSIDGFEDWTDFVTTRDVEYNEKDLLKIQVVAAAKCYWFLLPRNAAPYTQLLVTESHVREINDPNKNFGEVGD